MAMWSVRLNAAVPVAQGEPSDSDTVVVHAASEWISGTLPVLYVNTQNGEDITSKEDYLQGSYYLDAMGLEGYESIGSAESPLALQIRGRGNATWQEIKKPFRLKLDKKASLLGMKKSKHFVLLANAQEVQCRFDLLGFELSRRLGMAWTPTMKPIELVINGDYRGFYYLCENIRVDADRVNVVEQADEETDAEAVTGGWLVEIENTVDESQILFPDHGHGGNMRVTYHSPEVLSDEQMSYLVGLLTAIDNAIYNEPTTSTAFTDIIDLDALARFYVIQEIMDNGESFSGSCYWHKERGADTKVVFGPVWDFGSSLCHWRQDCESFIYENTPSYSVQRWIGDLAKFRIFQMKVREVWDEFKQDHWGTVFNVFDEHETLINSAIVRDRKRWPEYGITHSLHSRYNTVKNAITAKVNWLDGQWQPFNTYIAGTFTDWEDGKLAMTQASDGSFNLTVNGVADGDEFRFIDYDGTTYGGPDDEGAYAISRAQSSNIKLSADGQNFTVSGSGNLTFTLSPDMKLTVTGWDDVRGDVNGDGLVSGADVTALYNVLLIGVAVAGNPDVNGDGVVSGADVTTLYSLLLQ